jgi:hypothetical protein
MSIKYVTRTRNLLKVSGRREISPPIISYDRLKHRTADGGHLPVGAGRKAARAPQSLSARDPSPLLTPRCLPPRRPGPRRPGHGWVAPGWGLAGWSGGCGVGARRTTVLLGVSAVRPAEVTRRMGQVSSIDQRIYTFPLSNRYGRYIIYAL